MRVGIVAKSFWGHSELNAMTFHKLYKLTFGRHFLVSCFKFATLENLEQLFEPFRKLAIV